MCFFKQSDAQIYGEKQLFNAEEGNCKVCNKIYNLSIYILFYFKKSHLLHVIKLKRRKTSGIIQSSLKQNYSASDTSQL